MRRSGRFLGEDGKPFKTRSGESVKLQGSAAGGGRAGGEGGGGARGGAAPEKRAAVNRAVGIGAVKYADLRQDRMTDYVFAWDRMLSLQGNTGPYLQMQYTRIRSDLPQGGHHAGGRCVAARP